MSVPAIGVTDPFPAGQPDTRPSAPVEHFRPSIGTNLGPSEPSDVSNRTSTEPVGPSPGASTASSNDPWRPIVLSLDGGGIRGLSSLFIIREIMKEIRTLENENSGGSISERLPLPCHYFDFMVGTSTGGLISIMLSRLRMDIDDCIREYHVLGNLIFRPHKWKLFRYMSESFQYSPDKFKTAVENVVSKYCGCINGQRARCKNHYLRQDDFAEEGDVVDESQINKTCKAAVISLREGGETSGGTDAADVTYLFRTYNHRYRGGPFRKELNPRILDRSTLTIVEACRATSAAPTLFPPVKLRGRKYIDGGVTDHNNPALLAWLEANEMAHKPGEEDARGTKGPQVLLSIGTGKTKRPRSSGLYNLFLAGRYKLTDTEAIHSQLEGFTVGGACLYRRFNVPESNRSFKEKGLDTIKLDACKKERLETFWRNSGNSQSADSASFQDAEAETAQGGYKPNKYRYKTYEKIRQRTLRYCKDGNSVDDIVPRIQIEKCAKELFALSLQRRQDQVRWKGFQENPNPQSRAPPNLQSQNSMGLANQADSQPNL